MLSHAFGLKLWGQEGKLLLLALSHPMGPVRTPSAAEGEAAARPITNKHVAGWYGLETKRLTFQPLFRRSGISFFECCGNFLTRIPNIPLKGL